MRGEQLHPVTCSKMLLATHLFIIQLVAGQLDICAVHEHDERLVENGVVYIILDV